MPAQQAAAPGGRGGIMAMETDQARKIRSVPTLYLHLPMNYYTAPIAAVLPSSQNAWWWCCFATERHLGNYFL